MKINEVEVSGFKGISNLVIRPKQINIIVGKNNTGKTSILEAIHCTLGVDIFKMQRKYYPHVANLININKKESKVLVKLEDKNYYLLLTRPELKEILPEFKKELLNKLKSIAPKTTDKSESWKKAEKILDKILSKDELLSELENESIRIESSGKKLNLFSYTQLILKEIEPLLDYVDKEIFQERFGRGMLSSLFTIRFPHFVHNKKEENPLSIINNLALEESLILSQSKSKINKIQNYLQDRKILKNLERFDFDKLLFKQEGKEYEIPYSFMGDGFKSLVGLISRTSEENKIVLIEEPETRMHPAYMREVICQIINFSKINNMQFFVTTHSSDLLDIILTDTLEPKYAEYLSKELNVIRLDYLGGDIIAQELNMEEAKEELEELKIDLREK